MGTEVKDRKTLKEAADAARVELAGKRKELAKAEEARMFAAAAAEKGTAKDRAAKTRAEDTVARLREEVALSEREVRQREIELDRFLAEGEELGRAEYARWIKELRARVAKLGARLLEVQEQAVAIVKEMAPDVLEAERKTPVKLVARRCLRTVAVEVLDEGLLERYGERMQMAFFNARRAQDEGKVRIIPDEKLTLVPGDFEYERRTPPLSADLEAVKNIDLGLMFGETDRRKELTFDAIVSMIEEDEKTKAEKAAGRKS